MPNSRKDIAAWILLGAVVGYFFAIILSKVSEQLISYGANFALSKEFVDLTGHLAWPGTIVILVFLALSHFNDFMTIFKARMADPNTPVTIGKDGVTIGAQESHALQKDNSVTINGRADIGAEAKNNRKILTDKISADTNFRSQLTEWAAQHKLSVTTLLDGKEHDQLRSNAVQHFKLNQDWGKG